MESLTYMKNLRMTPKKLRFYLNEVKKLSPSESLKHLYYGKQKATRVMYKAIESAIANATAALKTSADLLKFKVLTVEEGQTLKRYLPGSRGNAKPIKKHMSHIKIILVAKASQVNEVKKAVETKNEETLKIKKQPASAKATVGKEK